MLDLHSFGFVPRAVAAEAPPTEIVRFDHAKVDAAFAKELPLLANSSYKIMAGRRVTPGKVEVHDHGTDIFYIMEGSATFATCGTVAKPTTATPGETRREAASGGVPHRLTEVGGTLRYFVVMVDAVEVGEERPAG